MNYELTVLQVVFYDPTISIANFFSHLQRKCCFCHFLEGLSNLNL